MYPVPSQRDRESRSVSRYQIRNFIANQMKREGYEISSLHFLTNGYNYYCRMCQRIPEKSCSANYFNDHSYSRKSNDSYTRKGYNHDSYYDKKDTNTHGSTVETNRIAGLGQWNLGQDSEVLDRCAGHREIHY